MIGSNGAFRVNIPDRSRSSCSVDRELIPFMASGVVVGDLVEDDAAGKREAVEDQPYAFGVPMHPRGADAIPALTAECPLSKVERPAPTTRL